MGTILNKSTFFLGINGMHDRVLIETFKAQKNKT